MAKKKAVVKKEAVKKEVTKDVFLKKKPWAPLSKEFAVISIIGFIIAAYLVKRSPSWSIAFMVLFAAMFVASLISMGKAPIKGLK